MTWLTPIANHLWQSTLVAGIAGILAIVLRKNYARIRYWIWLAASFKFLVPFSLFITIGAMIPSPHGRTGKPGRLPVAVEEIAQPFVLQPSHVGPSVRVLDSSSNRDTYFRESLALAWLLGCAVVLIAWVRQWRRVRMIIRESREVTGGRELQIMRRLQPTTPLRLRWSSERIEPGVVGIFRPVLLLPDGIGERLTAAELEAILGHELTHVRRRDNLFAGLHSIVEAIFWFHPAVWWIGERLIAERERACDEAVLQSGNNPEIYAEGILKVCEHYVKAPLACASGVSGSSLRTRIEAIVARDVSTDLNTVKRLALAGLGIFALVVPVAIGMSHAPLVRAQSGSAAPLSFEVVSVKPDNSGDQRPYSWIYPNGNFTATNTALWDLILNAYWVPNYLVSGAPDWIKREKFDIDGKVPANAIPEGISMRGRTDITRRMIQTMLAERFKLAVHFETKEMPIYELVVAKNGPKLTKAPDRDCETVHCHSWGPGNPTMQGGFPGTSVDIDDLIDVLRLWVNRPVVNKANLQGMFDMHLQFNPRPAAQPERPRNEAPNNEGIVNADSASLPDIFTALPEQLGLKLESGKGQVQTIVIDHVERPTAN
jgi:bla regulator protein BlaR1